MKLFWQYWQQRLASIRHYLFLLCSGRMGNYLITGRPGSGKSTVIKELCRRGYQAFNTDDLPNVTQLEEQVSGKTVPWPSGPVNWKKYIWNWQEDGLKELLSLNGDVFVGAIVGNQKQYYSLFDKIFALTVTGDTLQRRLNTHGHERTDDEKSRALAVHEEKQSRFKEQGLILIPADRPVLEIVDELIARL